MLPQVSDLNQRRAEDIATQRGWARSHGSRVGGGSVRGREQGFMSRDVSKEELSELELKSAGTSGLS